MSIVEILEGAKGMFMRYGIKSVTMDDVAGELGISKKTLYQHVENKQDLITRIIQKHISEEKEMIEKITVEASDPIEQVVLIARHVIKKLRQVRPTTMFDLKKYYRDCWSMMDKFHLEYVYQTIRTNIEEGQNQGLYREDCNPHIIAKLYVGMVFFLTDEEMFPMRDYDRDELYAQYITYHLRGLVSEAGLEQLKTYQPLNS